MDNRSSELRSRNMANIHSSNTKPEITVRHFLYHQGFRYYKNVASMPGKPDIVITKYRTVIFVNGCFWHHHEGCKYFVWPKSNVKFWEEKINRNVERDEMHYNMLREDGWKIIIVWECMLKKNKEQTLAKLADEIRK